MRERYERCILGTCCVPWDDGYRFEEGIFRSHVRRLLQTGTDHIYIFGTAGEGHAVSDALFESIGRAFVDEMADGGGRPMVGVINTSLATILHRIDFACGLGVRDFQISIPSWGECSFKEAHRFFEEICARFPGCRFLHYNTVRGGRVLTPGEYAELAKAFPNFAGTKNTMDSLATLIRLMEDTPELTHFLTEIPFAQASLLGYEAGFLISIAGTNWERAKEFYRAAVGGDRERVASDIIELQRIHSVVISLRRDRRMSDGAYDKLYHKIADREFPLRLLPPYEYFTDEEFGRLLRTAAANRSQAWVE
jgi:dihydrodipicolinate synthase/N-acetylneuraminate lyase